MLQLAIENIQPAIRKIRDDYPGIIYDTSSGNILSNMKTARSFFILEKDSYGDVFRNQIPIKIIGGSKIQIGNDKYNIGDETQNVFLPIQQKNQLKS